MSKEPPAAGSVGWTDLTVADAEEIRDFYCQVTGWKAEPVDMGGYNDFTMMMPGSGEPVAGICHARGANEGLPPQWLVYITVQDVDASAVQCEEMGGTILAGPRSMGEYGRYCVIRDPAGAAAALFTPLAKLPD